MKWAGVFRGFSDTIQVYTYANISPGSSGGALLNMGGELIGITTAEMAGGQNLNFAVPIKCREAASLCLFAEKAC